MAWQGLAACLDEDPEIFYMKFPQKAKAICARCPVTQECLEAAMEHEKKFSPRGEKEHFCGVWGGKSKSERIMLALIREQGAA